VQTPATAVPPELLEGLNDKQKQAAATMALYKERGVNPFSGFLLILIQIPIIIALYQIFLKNGLPVIETGILYSFVPAPENVSISFLGLIDITKKSLFLALLAGVTKCGGGITLRIPQPVGGSVTTAIKYTVFNGMGRSAGIHGLIMPLLNTPEELRNEESIFIGQSDVAEMITLLRERAPENDRVKYWEMKYAKLVKKVDEEEKRDKEVEEEMEREKATAEMEEVPY